MASALGDAEPARTAIRTGAGREPAAGQRVWYGSDDDQGAELYLPSEPATAGPLAAARAAVLVHGGFWESRWTASLMDAMAQDLAARGWIVWNLEYRRPDRWSWEETADDLTSGVAALAGALAAAAGPSGAPAGVTVQSGPVEVVGIGHSAGAQLIARVAADQTEDSPVRIGLVVNLAGILDLVETDRLDLGPGAVRRALGGTPVEVPDRYAASDPTQLLPLGVPQLVVQGLDDAKELVDMSRAYAWAAQRSGDRVRHVELAGDHFAVIDPASEIWAATLAAIDEISGRTT